MYDGVILYVYICVYAYVYVCVLLVCMCVLSHARSPPLLASAESHVLRDIKSPPSPRPAADAMDKVLDRYEDFVSTPFLSDPENPNWTGMFCLKGVYFTEIPS